MKKVRILVEKDVPDGTDILTVTASPTDKILNRNEVTFMGFSVFEWDDIGFEDKPPGFQITLHLGPRGSNEQAVGINETPELIKLINQLKQQLESHF